MSELDDILHERTRFAVGLRYELFYAVQALADPDTRVHAAWRQRCLAALPEPAHAALQATGGGPSLWGVIADTLRTAPPDLSFASLVARLAGQELREFQREIVHGALHDDASGEQLLAGTLDLAGALGRSGQEKRAWLAFAGLYPYDPAKPMIRALERVLADPAGFRRDVVTLLSLFWRHAFQATWQALLPQLRRSVAEKERLFAACSFAELVRAAHLRLEVNEGEGYIQAVRGGYRLAAADVARAFLIPSAFNDKRFWCAYEESDGTHVYLPYFDPSLVVDGAPSPAAAEPELDVALIFKALGEPTRFAMAELLAKAPLPSVELARRLGVSKPTVAHHVHLLREAGLLVETPAGGSVLLALRRAVIATLGERTVRRFYGDDHG